MWSIAAVVAAAATAIEAPSKATTTKRPKMMLLEHKYGHVYMRQTSSLNDMHENMDESTGALSSTGHASTKSTNDITNMGEDEVAANPSMLVPLETTLNFVKLNVGGRVFTTRMRHFASYPQSRLGKLMREISAKKILHYCDAYHPGVKDPTMGSTSTPIPLYYFDYSGTNFDMILDLYRHGTLHVKDGTICPMVIRRDLDYWGIDEYLFDPCCTFRFQQGTENCYKDIEEAEREERNAQKETDDDPFGSSPIEKVRRFLWHTMEFPDSSVAAKVIITIA